jgi:hypothetical protein
MYAFRKYSAMVVVAMVTGGPFLVPRVVRSRSLSLREMVETYDPEAEDPQPVPVRPRAPGPVAGPRPQPPVGTVKSSPGLMN